MAEEGTTIGNDADVTRINDLLRTFDSAIQWGRGEDPKPHEHENLDGLVLSCILKMAGYDVQRERDINKKTMELLGAYQKTDQRKLIAVCLLRLLPESAMKWISEPPWRPRIAAFLDSQFAEDLYQDCKLDKDLLAHKKLERLAQITKDQESRFLESLQSLTSLDRLKVHRQKIMGVINNKIARLLIHPFIPDAIIDELNELFTRVENYIQHRNDLSIVDAHRGVTDAVRKFVQLAETKGTIYSRWLSDKVGHKLSTLIEKDFANNRAVQPSKVIVEAREKKYPFHLVTQKVNLGFIVKNQGPGYAYDTKLTVLSDEEIIRLSSEEIEIGRLAPTEIQLVEIPSEVIHAQEEVDVILSLNWNDYDGTQHIVEDYPVLSAQKSDIDWERLAQSDPYSLEPVITEQELVGRRDTLNRLIGSSRASTVGSSIIQGQKRVGKTSIAKVFQSHLERQDYLVIYLEGGDYVEPTSRATIARLGITLCNRIKYLEPRVAHIDVPEFDEAFAALTGFLDNVIRIIPNRPIVIILDEFDELPLDLYTRGPLGDAFFLTLRSIGSRPTIGFVLVGGEKMTLIMDCQGDQLNKWSVISVDYFTRELDWADYRELVQRPVGGYLEYTEDALMALHDATAGNPYFTKLVCQYVFRMMVNRRDCYITRTEINQAIEMAVRETARNTFQHFWEDGIFEAGERAAEKSTRRRKILIALCDTLARQSTASVTMIAEHPIVHDIPTVDTDLREFVTRKVLVENRDNTYDFKVRLFQQWLKGRGVHDLIATFSDLDAALKEREREEQLKIQSNEVVSLIQQWGPYNGQAITEDKVRAWLEQFGGFREQRSIFPILKGLRFYSNAFIRQKMVEADKIVKHGLVHRIESGRLKRSDILVSYLDGPAKSGAALARLYADEAQIYVENVVEKGKLDEVLQKKTEVQALVFIDDFVGTGQSALDYLEEVNTKIAEIVCKHNIKVLFVAVLCFYRRLETS
jgi:hypothetical protein